MFSFENSNKIWRICTSFRVNNPYSWTCDICIKESMIILIIISYFPDIIDDNYMATPDDPACHSYSVWCSLINKHLGRKNRHHTLDIIHNLVAVDRSVKRAYLLDFGINSVDDLIKLLDDLVRSKCLKSQLNIYHMEMDVVIINPQCFQCLQEVDFGSNVLIINVSSSLEKPKITCLNDCSVFTDIQEFVRKLPFYKNSVSKFKINTLDVNLTTIFGLMLGYPFIYWFDKNSELNCLSMLPLRCCEVRWTLDIEGVPNTSDNTHTIFSFSIPECLVDENVKTKLEKWFELRKEHDDCLQLSSRTETLPAVAL